MQHAEVWITDTVVTGRHWHGSLELTAWTRLSEAGNDGRFAAKIDRPVLQAALARNPEAMIRFAATADGFGWGWVDVKASGLKNGVTLKLVDDVSIEGRILSLDGTPAVGVKLHVNHILANVNIDGIVKSAAGSSGIYTNSPAPPFNGGGPNFKSIMTDSDGRFRLTGMGAERGVRLEAIGGGIGAARFKILTRATPAELKPRGTVDVREGLAESTYYADFTHIAAPGRTIQGTVTDAGTGAQIAGVRISSRSAWHSMMNPVTTDADGRYEMIGVPNMRQYRALVFEAAATQHFNKSIKLTDSPGLEPVVVNVSLLSGISVKGRMTDDLTGQPLSGAVTYSPVFPNENWSRLGESPIANPAATSIIGDDGRYEICVLPGPGVLTAQVRDNGIMYVSTTLDVDHVRNMTGNQDNITNEHGEVRHLPTHSGEQSRGVVGFSDKHAAALVNPSQETTELTVDLKAIPGRSLRGTIVDDKGVAVSGVKVSWLGPGSDPESPLESGEFTVTNLPPTGKRSLYFQHAERKLGIFVVVDGGQHEPINVRLRPTGIITGQFVDNFGEPLPDIQIELSAGGENSSYLTDADGRFEVSGVIPDAEFTILAKPNRQPGPMPYVGKVRVGSGMTVDIGSFTQKNTHQYRKLETDGDGKASSTDDSDRHRRAVSIR